MHESSLSLGDGDQEFRGEGLGTVQDRRELSRKELQKYDNNCLKQKPETNKKVFFSLCIFKLYANSSPNKREYVEVHCHKSFISEMK